MATHLSILGGEDEEKAFTARLFSFADAQSRRRADPEGVARLEKNQNFAVPRCALKISLMTITRGYEAWLNEVEATFCGMGRLPIAASMRPRGTGSKSVSVNTSLDRLGEAGNSTSRVGAFKTLDKRHGLPSSSGPFRAHVLGNLPTRQASNTPLSTTHWSLSTSRKGRTANYVSSPR